MMEGNRKKLLLFCAISEMLIIILIAISCMLTGFFFYLFYNFMYGIVVSLLLPLFFLSKEKQGLTAVGIKKVGCRQIIVLTAFIAFSVGGQLIPKILTEENIVWERLPLGILPLIMTTFFEEFLFRGFLQTRLEKCFGSISAIGASGLLFSLYHLGYPGFRKVDDLLLLFAVGIGFAIAFKLSGNNLIVSYFVNLPNAFVTYVFKYGQFPEMTAGSSLYAGITILGIGVVLFYYKKRSILFP